MIPSYWTEHREYSDGVLWRESEVSRCSDVVQVYDDVTEKFDAFLAERGYVREGGHYRVEKESTETVTFFLPFWDHLRAPCPSVVPFRPLRCGTAWHWRRLL